VGDFLRAFSFLTILPIGRNLPPDEKGLARSMAFFPLTGFIIGLLLALGFYLLSSLFPRPLALWLTIGLMAILTGGLHLDGFADTIDGLACRGTKERVMEVMRDSRGGAFGVLGLILLIGTKYLALDQLSTLTIPYALILMTVTVAVFGLDQKGVGVLGTLPSGLPSITLPRVPPADYLRLLPGAMAVVGISLCEALLLVRSCSRKHNTKADGDQVLFAYGMASIVSGFTGSLVSGPSAARTAAMDAAGSRTQLSSLVAAVAIALVTVFFTTC